MTDPEQLAEAIRRSFPTAQLEITLPQRVGQAGWLDISSEGRSIAVEWRPGIGFGVSVLPDLEEDPSFGLFEGPDEVFEHRPDAEERIMALLDSTSRPRMRVE